MHGLRQNRLVRNAVAWAAMGLLAPALGECQSGGFDHSRFDRLLRTHVDERGMVDYDGLRSTPEIQRYLAALDGADPSSLSSPEQLALWINAYNAYTIALINRHGERRSIRNINKTLGVFSRKGPWKEPIARVGGRAYTLDQIEHEIIRKQFREPRIHFALVCAAKGCPPLRREAYTAGRLDAQLDDQARTFLLHSPEKNRVDVAKRTVHLSPIFEWFGSDFGDGRAALGRYLAAFHPPGPARDLLLAGDFRIAYTSYDWSLNLQERGRRGPR